MRERSERVSVSQASEVLGLSPNEIRFCMRTNRFNPPIGQVRKSSSGKSFRYDVYKNKVMEYAGLKEWPQERS